MEQRTSIKTTTGILSLMLAIGILALVTLLYVRQQPARKTLVLPTQQAQVSGATETPTGASALLGQASSTPLATSQGPQPPRVTPAIGQTQFPLSTVIAAVEGTVLPQATSQAPVSPTTVSVATSIAPPTAEGPVRVDATPVPQNSVPTAIAAGGGGNTPENPPHSVPGTGGEDPTPMLTPAALLPSNQSAGSNAGGHADGSAKVNTPQPAPKLPNAPPTATVVKVVATAKPQPGQIVLPNGVVYGERKPNLPNRIVRIMSTNIKLDTSVYEVYSPKGVWEVADYAAGHNYNSKNPGEGGNIVLAGHNNWHGEVFRYVSELKPGDLIKVWTLDGKEHHYTVQSANKVLEAGASYAQRLQNAKVMDPTSSEQLTLITCWPYTTYTHRVIVIAKPSP